MKKILFTLTLAVLAFSACNKEAVDLKGKGQMSINLTSEGEFTPSTKADETNPDVVDINTFEVSILNASGASVYSWENLAAVPAVIAMDPASYTIKANSPGKLDVAWNQPIYEGTQTFAVEAGKVANIDLTCKLSNMKVTVKCTDNFIEELNPDFTIKVSTANGFLEYTKAIIDKGTAQAGYFTVAPITVDIKGTRKLDGSTVSHYFTINEVAARDHHVFTVDASETGEVAVGGGISVDYSVNQKDVDIQVGDLEENPIEDDNTGAPVVKGASIAANSVVAPTLGSINVTYSLPIALASDANITLGDVPVSASVSGKVLTVSFGTLAYATAYTLNVPAGAVINATDNSEASAYSLSFTTEEEAQEVPITITATGGIEANAVYTEGQYGVTFTIDIAAEKGIKSFPVEIQSDGLKGLIYVLENGCTENVDLANMSDSENEFWGGMFGKSDTDIYGATTVQFSIGGFIAMMPVGTHPIKMTVIDNEDNEKTVTITFVINAK